MKTTDKAWPGHRGLSIIAGFAMLALVAWMDQETGVEISFSVFYLLPVSLVAWIAGLVPGLIISIAGAIVWLLMDYTFGGKVYSSPFIAYWNSLVRFCFFAGASVSLSLIHKMVRREREASRLKSEMVSMISHEFNNSLATMNLVSTLLQEADGASIPLDRLKLYSILDQTSQSLKQLVKNFLNKARLESGRFKLETQPTELRKIIDQVVVALRPLSDAKSITIQTDFPPEVIPVRVDQDAIILVMSNLIGNAIKYTPKNGLVGIEIARQQGSPGQVKVSVRDTGIGIDEKDLEAIFSGFYRTAGGKTSAKGFGIGLKVTKDLLEAHKSRLSVKSSPGLGSIFSFPLPVWGEES